MRLGVGLAFVIGPLRAQYPERAAAQAICEALGEGHAVASDWSELEIPDSDFSIAELYAAVDAQRQSRGLSWKGVAEQVSASGPISPRPVSPSTISGMRDKAWGVEGDTVLQVLLWLDRTPESFVPGHPGANQPEARLRKTPGSVLRFDVPGIYAKLDAQRRESGMSWQEVAAEVGGLAKVDGLKRMKTGTRAGFPGVMRLARWLKRPAAELTRVSPW